MNHPPTPLNIPELLTQIDVSPQRPGNYNPPIGVFGCGGITVEHLTAYRNAGLHVARSVTSIQNEPKSVGQSSFPTHVFTPIIVISSGMTRSKLST